MLFKAWPVRKARVRNRVGRRFHLPLPDLRGRLRLFGERKRGPHLHITVEDVRRVRRRRLPTRDEVDLRLLEHRMLDLINRERTTYYRESRHARPLLWDEGVAAVARRHSADMIRRRFMDHVDPSGDSPFDRLRRGEVSFAAAGENIAGGPRLGMTTGFASIEQAHAALMNEPPYQENHRGNILNPSFTHVGVGIALNSDGRMVITQDFVGRT